MREVQLRSLVQLALIGAAISVLPVRQLTAQVGHPPGDSPFRDIRKGHTLTAVGGYFRGTGGEFNIGPHKGGVYGGRYDIRTGSTIQIGLGLAHGSVDRFIVNPFVLLANRRSGPVKQSLTLADIGFQLNVTGGKSWNRLAPFFAAGLGLAFAGDTPADTSRYDFGRKFYLAPSIGTRVFLSDRLHIRAEAKAVFWKLNYPTTFQVEPVEKPGTPDEPNAVIPGDNLSEWTASPWLQIGVGFAFSP